MWLLSSVVAPFDVLLILMLMKSEPFNIIGFYLLLPATEPIPSYCSNRHGTETKSRGTGKS